MFIEPVTVQAVPGAGLGITGVDGETVQVTGGVINLGQAGTDRAQLRASLVSEAGLVLAQKTSGFLSVAGYDGTTDGIDDTIEARTSLSLTLDESVPARLVGEALVDGSVTSVVRSDLATP